MAAVGGVAVAGIVVVTVADVVGRQFGLPVKGAYDLVRVLGAIAMGCALPLTKAVKGHIAIEYFFQKLGGRGRASWTRSCAWSCWRCSRCWRGSSSAGEEFPGQRRGDGHAAHADVLGAVARRAGLPGDGGRDAVASAASGPFDDEAPVMSELQIGLLGIALLFLLLATSMPVAFAMTIVGLAGFAVVVNVPAALHVLATDYYDTFSSYGLTVIPLFVFMGQVAFHTGISRKLFAAAHQLVRVAARRAGDGDGRRVHGVRGHLRVGAGDGGDDGGGGAAGDARYKYDPGFAAGTVAAGGSIGMMIPPSVVFIVYGVMTEQSIGKLFIAGIVPGLLVAALFLAW
jgi:hypothetical protein